MTRVPAAHAHAHGDEDHEEADLSLRDRPIDLVDIAQVLGESAHVERLGEVAVRTWRDELTLIQESLRYARTILAADVAILSHAGSPETAGPRSVDNLANVLAASPQDPRSEPGGEDVDPEIDPGLFIRADHLLAAHREMAGVNLSSPAAATRLQALLEDQLAILTERQAAVEARLQQIRALIIRRYRDAASAVRDQSA